MDKVLSKAFPIPVGTTERRENNAKEIQDHIRSIYANERNAGGFGNNGWSLSNAIGEYLDHARGGKAEERALASMQVGSWVDKKKAQVVELILA